MNQLETLRLLRMGLTMAEIFNALDVQGPWYEQYRGQSV